MAVIHISEEEAARDLGMVLEKVKAGERVHIARGQETIAIVQPASADTPRKTLSGAIRWAREQNLQTRLDEKFSDDLEQVVCNHQREGSRSLWED